MKISRSTFLPGMQTALSAFASMFIAWVLLLLLLRTGDWLLNGFTHNFPGRNFLFLLYAVMNDLLFACQTGCWLLPVFLLASLISLKSARMVFLIIITLLTLGYLALIQYFNSTTVLLGSDLYGYSWKEIKQTIGASGALGWTSFLFLAGFLGLMAFLFFVVSRKIKPAAKSAALIAGIMILLAGSAAVIEIPRASFQREYDNDLAENKLGFFLGASFSYFFPEPAETDIYSDAYIQDYEDAGDNRLISFSYPDEQQFPFLHKDSITDVLSPFFQRSATPPDIVIIVIEGLGRAFSNEGAYLGSFTPFLDSLSRGSLYWENFLSGGGRTFAALPTILGSLPFGKNGFNEQKEKMPPHLSLASILKKNGYHTSFSYAGDASFDDMDLFMQKQSVDLIRERRTFPADYLPMPAFNGFSWGFGDKEMYRYFLGDRASASPSLDIILTVATHSPFRINDQSAYEELARKRISALGLPAGQEQDHLKYLAEYATILYADDALRGFMKECSRKPGYENTIFIITGDHRMPDIPLESRIDRFHVPLLISSPLLKRPARFASVSSQFDLAPSLLAFLASGYGVETPGLASWLGSGLDTARRFRNIHSIPLMQTKTDLVDFVMGEYHLNGNELYRLNSSLGEEKLNDAALLRQLQGAFARFKQKNEQFSKSGQLLPDSLIKKYYPGVYP